MMHSWHADLVVATIGPEGHTRITVAGIRFDAHRLIYATIILLVSLAIYDDEVESFTSADFVNLVVVVVMPLLALSFAHAFADALDIQIRTRRRLTTHDRRHLLAAAFQYLSVGVPVLVLALLFEAVGGQAWQASEWGQAIGVLSLFLWGAFAARASGLGPWVQARFALFYGLVGIGIIAVELLIMH